MSAHMDTLSGKSQVHEREFGGAVDHDQRSWRVPKRIGRASLEAQIGVYRHVDEGQGRQALALELVDERENRRIGILRCPRKQQSESVPCQEIPGLQSGWILLAFHLAVQEIVPGVAAGEYPGGQTNAFERGGQLQDEIRRPWILYRDQDVQGVAVRNIRRFQC